MSELTSSLELLRAAFDRAPVRVMALRDVGPLRLPSGSIVSAKRGERVELPRWMARALEERGAVVRLLDRFSVEDLLRVHYREMERRSLSEIQKLPEDFYRLAAEYLEVLEVRLKSSPDYRLLEERRRVEECLSEVAEKRLASILDLVIAPRGASELKARLAPEELELYERVSSLVAEWSRVASRGGR
ncbi:MAG: hypothetical protein QXU97_00245 [Fervidicoccaceae archaeon]